ncbi:DUF3297 family protein [Aeromonas cavernicola]|uniref:DUF3297 family protein n=1 Tax=Aeromonas cavernicola TaxID=1006623 RepID=UPI0012FE019C|nr:DUF3297 family protein [Aeromonas cavernicola]
MVTCFAHPIGIRLRTAVAESCISGGWVKISSPKALDRCTQSILIKRKSIDEAL